MSELFDKSSEKSAKGKLIIDIDNEYDNSKTFIMVSPGNEHCATVIQTVPEQQNMIQFLFPRF